MRSVRIEPPRIEAPRESPHAQGSHPSTPPKEIGVHADSAPVHQAPAIPAEVLSGQLRFGRSAPGGPRYLKVERDGAISLTSDRSQKSSRADVAKALTDKVNEGNLGVSQMSFLYRNADALLEKRSAFQRFLDFLGLSKRLSNINNLKRSIATQIPERPGKAVRDLSAALGKGVDIPSYWREALPGIFGRNQQLIDPLTKALHGQVSDFSDAIFGRGLQTSPEEFKILNALNLALQERHGGLTNRQFHTDSIPSLVFQRGDPANVSNKTDRFYANLDQFQKSLAGEQTDIYPEVDDALRSRLKPQIAAASQLASAAGYPDLQWFPGNREPGFVMTHAGWIPESLPTDTEKATLKATRTLGLMNGDASRTASVPLDLSSLGPLSLEQAKAAMNLVQEAALDVANKKPVSGFTDSPTDSAGRPLFSADQMQLLKTQASEFAAQSQNILDAMHKELRQAT